MDRIAYEEGQQAYWRGDTEDTNPYPKQFGNGKKRMSWKRTNRYAWFMGWYDAWRLDKHDRPHSKRFHLPYGTGG